MEFTAKCKLWNEGEKAIISFYKQVEIAYFFYNIFTVVLLYVFSSLFIDLSFKKGKSIEIKN